MKYKDLFIDFDDTLYDTYGNANIALHETFRHFRLQQYCPNPQIFFDAYWAANIDLWKRYAKGEITRDYLIIERFRRPLLAASSPTSSTATSGDVGEWLSEAFILEISDQFLDYCASKPGVVDGAHELMDYLKGKGYRLHLCSNGFHEVQYKKLNACGLRDHFDTIILSEDAGANKPSPLYFDYAFKVSGAKPETTLMIGDNYQTDIQGALKSGINALLFNRWGEKQFDPQFPPTYIVDSLLSIKNIL